MKNLYVMCLILLLLPFTAAYGQEQTSGAVYSMSNSASGNSVVVFNRAEDGILTPAGSYPTEGLGTGTGLGNQGALILSQSKRRLFVVNPGSDEISVFKIRAKGVELELQEKVPSGGRQPISLTQHGDLLYVLNAGGNVGDADNITGFLVDGTQLIPLPGSTRALSAGSTGPAQIEFSEDGSLLIVTEKNTNRIDTFVVDEDGLPGTVNSLPSNGMTPFGFAFGKKDRLIVSEAFGGAVDASAVSSYTPTENGNLQVLSPSVPTTETAACWVVITKNGRYAYVTNTGSGTISGYAISKDGSLELLNSNGVTAVTGPGSAPIDMALSPKSRFLYSLNSGSGSISSFQVADDGSLTSIGPDITGLPAGTNGLAAR